ncbi:MULTISPECIES: amidohydrolase [unclassified Thermosipho (in: thermotogales)]|uniref:amidohydrolase n=1 Tax=unclassified Thermosipho (in: thermotogales) TaxID=2676525 RepID=UPI000986AC48|nr:MULTISPECIES: amidohydrolase family protein [unclassified Thermosipho (in: thermotogales)]
MMVVKFSNGYVWKDGNFVKKDFFVEGNKFVYPKKFDKEVNLEGKYILPGFSDSHAHILGVGIKKLTLDLSDENFEKILDIDSDIILGRGWEKIDNKDFFDTVKSPVILIRKCGHVAFLNRKAQRLLKINDYYIFEDEIEKIWEYIPSEFLVRAFKEGINEFLKHGITSVHSDDLHGISFELLKRLLKESKLRVYEKLCTKNPWEFEFGSYGISKIFGIKLFADGSLGGKTAFLSKMYKNNSGFSIFTLPDNFSDIVKFAEKNNLQVCVHTIGDEALSRTIEAFGKKTGHRIIHAQFVKKRDFEKLSSFSFSVQPHFFFEDLNLISSVDFSNILLYPFRNMYENNILISFSSDGPVSPISPLYVIQAALKLGFSFSESISLYTEFSGKLIKENIGVIKPQYLADFIIFKDKTLRNLEKVFVNGELVYDTLTLNP